MSSSPGLVTRARGSLVQHAVMRVCAIRCGWGLKLPGFRTLWPGVRDMDGEGVPFLQPFPEASGAMAALVISVPPSVVGPQHQGHTTLLGTDMLQGLHQPCAFDG